MWLRQILFCALAKGVIRERLGESCIYVKTNVSTSVRLCMFIYVHNPIGRARKVSRSAPFSCLGVCVCVCVCVCVLSRLKGLTFFCLNSRSVSDRSVIA